MSVAETHAALDAWLARITDLGAAVGSRLRPGLTARQAREIGREHGYDLSDDVTALWTWHDGERAGDDLLHPVKAFPQLIPFNVFGTLEQSLTRSRTIHEAIGDDVALADPTVPDDYKAILWQPHWVEALNGWLPLVLDGAAPDPPDTFRWNSQSGTAGVAHSSFPDRIARWHQKLDTGQWIVLPDGSWDIDTARIPPVPRDIPVADQIALTEIV